MEYVSGRKVGADGKYIKGRTVKSIMTDSCQNCGNPIPAHLEAEYCNRCESFEYGFMSAGDEGKGV